MLCTIKSFFVLWLTLALAVAAVPTAAVAATDGALFPRPPSIARRLGPDLETSRWMDSESWDARVEEMCKCIEGAARGRACATVAQTC